MYAAVPPHLPSKGVPSDRPAFEPDVSVHDRATGKAQWHGFGQRNRGTQKKSLRAVSLKDQVRTLYIHVGGVFADSMADTRACRPQ